jgi:hypothetical protein
MRLLPLASAPDQTPKVQYSYVRGDSNHAHHSSGSMVLVEYSTRDTNTGSWPWPWYGAYNMGEVRGRVRGVGVVGDFT